MIRLQRHGRIVWAMLAVLGVATGAAGQHGEGLGGSSPPLHLDMPGLLNPTAVFPESVAGPVWRVVPAEGRRLVVLPVILPVSDEVVTYDANALRLRGGRLLAWWIPAAASTNNGAVRPAAGAAQPAGGERPADGPRLTRAIEVHPDGTIHWQLDRILPGAQVVASENPYTLLLDRQRLASMAPGRPAAPTRNAGESTADYQQRRLEAMNAQREEMSVYRELQTRVRDLPETFSEPLASQGQVRVQAVFELRNSATTLEIQGFEPLPWEVGIEDLRAVGGLLDSRQRGGAGGGDGQAEAVLLDLLDRLPSAYSQRLAAEALRSLLAAQTGPLDDALLPVALALLEASDLEARRVAIAAVVGGGVSDAAMEVIERAADDADAVVRLHALRGQVRANVDQPDGLAAILPRINDLLADDSGPEAAVEAAAILAGVIAAPGLSTQQVDVLVKTLGPGLAFADVPAAHMQPLISAIVDLAPANRLAAYWLDRQLLGSSDQVTVRQTLATIAGLPLPSGSDATADAPPFGRPGAGEAAPPRLQLNGVEHHLLAHLASVDQAMRALAWEAALRFDIVGPTTASTAAAPTPVYLAAARAATVVEPILPQALLFLMRQPHIEGRVAGLMVLIGHADGPVAAQSASVLMQQSAGQGRLLATAMTSLDPAERDAFAASLYATISGQPSAVTGLLRLSGAANAGGERAGGNLTQWLADHLAAGRLPPPGAWVEAIGGEQSLLAQAAEQEPAVLSAAAAALVASAGGDREAQAALAREFLNLPEPTQPALEQAWAQAKRRMLLTRFQDVGGRYHMVITVADDQPFTEPPTETDGVTDGVDALIASLRGNVMNLGEIRLRADDQHVAVLDHTLRLDVSETDGARTLVIPQPAELSGVGTADLSALSPQYMQPPRLVEVRPGMWWATFTTMSGQHVQLLMVRVGD